MFGKIRISKADKLFSLYIRSKAGWSCERCKSQFKPPTNKLQCSHFFGRQRRQVRFTEENVASLCVGCHNHFTSFPHDHVEFFKKKLTKFEYDRLVAFSGMETSPVDEEAMERYFKMKLEAMAPHSPSNKELAEIFNVGR